MQVECGSSPLPEMCGMLGKLLDLVEKPLLGSEDEHYRELKVQGALHARAYGLCGQEVQDADVQQGASGNRGQGDLRKEADGHTCCAALQMRVACTLLQISGINLKASGAFLHVASEGTSRWDHVCPAA